MTGQEKGDLLIQMTS